MARSSSLSSDIDFIKEFEELRLKQKILIESLNRSRKDKHNDVIMEVNSKLDFLVKIFKEADDSFNEKQYLDDHFGALDKKLAEMAKSFDERLKALEQKVVAPVIGVEEKGTAAVVGVPKSESSKQPQFEYSDVEKSIHAMHAQVVQTPKAEIQTPKAEPPQPLHAAPVSQSGAQSPVSQAVPPLPDFVAAEKTQASVNQKPETQTTRSMPQTSDSQAPPMPDFVVDETKVEELAQTSGGEKKKKWF